MTIYAKLVLSFVLLLGALAGGYAANSGLTEVPYIHLPDNKTPIRFGLQCNADGQMTAADDVFDLAQLCWTLAEVEQWTGQQIASEVGWNTAVQVTQHKDIKAKLHPRAWDIARLTRNGQLVNGDDSASVNSELTNVKWSESHFRALLSHLPCPNGDRALMRAQVAAISELIGKEKLVLSFVLLLGALAGGYAA